MTDKPDIHTHTAALTNPGDKARYEEALKCNRCGFCTSFCPTYLATGDEGLSPRGRNQALRALLENRLADPAQAARLFDTCLLCGICTSVCFSEVPTAKLMSAGREKIMQARGEPWLLRLFLRQLLPRPRLFEAFLKVVYLGKISGVSRLLNRLGLLRWVDQRLAAAEDVVDDLPWRFLRSRLSGRAAQHDAQAVYFFACGSNFIRPSVGEASARLLDGAGARWGCAQNNCCGLPGISYGDLDAARALARKNIEIYEQFPQAVIVVDDSSCASTLKDYPALFESDPDWLPRAGAVARRVRDINEWLVEQPFTAPDGPVQSVTYHDPCKARYAQKIVDPPRRLLAARTDVDYRELPEADQCCGGGGTYSFMQPEISQAVQARKIQNIASTGASMVLTSSVSCLLQVAAGLRRAGAKTRALHLTEFLSPSHKEKP